MKTIVDSNVKQQAARVDAEDAPETQAMDAEPETQEDLEANDGGRCARRMSWRRVLGYGLLPALALLLAIGAGYLKWTDSSAEVSAAARAESVQAATDATIAMLSYEPDTVEQNLAAARDRLTGGFKDSYTTLTHDVVIPGSKQKHIAAMANVPAAASVSATPNHAVVLVFVNQTITMDNDAPTNTASSVKVSLDRIDGRWLIAGFDPI